MPQARSKEILPIVALIFSIMATGISVYFARMSLRTSVLPTLVFVYEGEEGWFLRNVGNGPALDPIVSHTKHGSDKWVKPTWIYPVDSGARVFLCWVDHNPDKIIVYYKDSHDRPYISHVDEDRTTIENEEHDLVWNPVDERRVFERRCP